MKTILLKFAFLLFLFGEVSCGKDIPDCPSQMCVIAGVWKLTEVFVDGVKDTGDLSKYQLELIMPNPTTATTSGFNRIQPSGNKDDGTWSIENKDTILRLISNVNPANPEDWQIESFTLRKLVLVITRNASVKGGPGKIQYNLEPF